MTVRRTLQVVLGIVFACCSGAATAAACGPNDVIGLFDGTGKPPRGSSIDITLNLLCANGNYEAQLFTSKGDFAVKDVRSTNGHVEISFDSGAAIATLDLAPRDNMLDGSFAGGTATFKKTGPAIAVDGLNPTMTLTSLQWHDDLRFLASELPKRHANAFFSFRERRSIPRLRRWISALTEQILMKFMPVFKRL
jgi:hypothetical protein